jgi:hypothetical protein
MINKERLKKYIDSQLEKAIGVLKSMRNDNKNARHGYDDVELSTHQTRTSFSITVTGVIHDQEKEKEPTTPTTEEKTPEGGYATGGVVEYRPGTILFGHYTPENDQETIIDFYYNIIDRVKGPTDRDVVVTFDFNELAKLVAQSAERQQFIRNALDPELTRVTKAFVEKAEEEAFPVSGKIGILDPGKSGEYVTVDAPQFYPATAGDWFKSGIGGSSKAPEVGPVAGVAQPDPRDKDGEVSGERNESPEPRTRHHVNEGSDR